MHTNGQRRYEIVESSETAGLSVEPPQRWEEADVEAWLLKHAIDIQDGAHISPDTDLFEQGFDRSVVPRIYASMLTRGHVV